MYRFSAWFLFFTRGAPCRYLENATGEHFFSQSSPVQHKLCYEVADETRSILAVYIILSNYIVETVGIRWHQEVGGRGQWRLADLAWYFVCQRPGPTDGAREWPY